MIGPLIVALAAGVAAALMYASLVTGAAMSLLLIYFSPLPLMVVGLGWSPRAGAVASFFATICIGVLMGLSSAALFAVLATLPAWWLTHLALLGRPMGNDASGQPQLEWYPAGRILMWIAAIAAVAVAAGLLSAGTSVEAITEAIRQMLSVSMRQADSDITADQIEAYVRFFVVMAPIAMPIFLGMMLTLNLWFAAKIALTSGRLHRPWPELHTIKLPTLALAALAAAGTLCLVGGIVAVLAKTVTAALLFACALTGLAVLHVLTLSLRNRTLWLVTAYGVMLLCGALIPAMAALGVADTVFGLRARYARTRPPPLPVS